MMNTEKFEEVYIIPAIKYLSSKIDQYLAPTQLIQLLTIIILKA